MDWTKIQRVGKVEVAPIAPNVFRMTVHGWVWYSGPHIERAIAELAKTHKIRSVSVCQDWINYRLVYVD